LLLEAVVASANRCQFLGVRYRPYLMMSDLAALLALGFALAFSSHLPQVSAFGLCAGILGALVSHKAVLEIKAALGAGAARSFLQDCLLVIIPIFIAINIAWGQPLNLTVAFLGLLLPLYGGIARMGCFLGGCCYEKPSQYGVLYPESIFTLEGNKWRRYSPSPDPRERVFPIQLVESPNYLSLPSLLFFFGNGLRQIGTSSPSISCCMQSHALAWTAIASQAHVHAMDAFRKLNWYVFACLPPLVSAWPICLCTEGSRTLGGLIAGRADRMTS
jgi:hypothetical protein